MKNYDLNRERRKQTRLEKLGSNNPVCGTCGETDWRCLELHHVAGNGRDEATVIICRNCHRKFSDSQSDHPTVNAAADPVLDQIGHFLLGLADMLGLVVSKLVEFGLHLIALAADMKREEAAQ